MKPTHQEAYARAGVLKHVVVHALSTPPKEILEELFSSWTDEQRREFDRACAEQAARTVRSLQNIGLWKYVSPSERLFLQSSGSRMDSDDRMAAAWRMECIGMLMWALGSIGECPPIDTQTSTDLLKEFEIVKMDRFSRQKLPPLRAAGEMMAKRRLMELWHWRIRTRGSTIPTGRKYAAGRLPQL